MSINKNILGGIGEAFSDRNFRIHSVGAIASWISFFVQIVTVSWVAWELTHSTTWLAIIALLDIIPNIILLPFGGALADRFDRYKIMMVFNPLLLLQALAITGFAMTGALTIWSLSILVLIHGILLSFSVPAMYGMLPRFVDKACLTSAIAVNSSYTQFAVFAGPALAGWVISSYGITVAFAINAMGYFIMIIAMLFLKTPMDYHPPAKSQHSVWGDIVSGLQYIRGHRGISTLLILALAGEALGAGIYHMVPAYADEFLQMGVKGVSLILASFGLGALISALWLAHQGVKVVTSHYINWAFLVFTLSAALLFLLSNIYLIVAACILLGLAGEIYVTGTMSLIQISVAESQRGRVMGNLFLLKQFAAGVGTYLIGAIAVSQGLAPPIFGLVVVCLLVWLWMISRRVA